MVAFVPTTTYIYSTLSFLWQSDWPCSLPNVTCCPKKWISARTASIPRVYVHWLRLCSGAKCKSDSDLIFETTCSLSHTYVHTTCVASLCMHVCTNFPFKFQSLTHFVSHKCYTPRARSFASAYVYMHLDGRIQAIGNTGKDPQTLGAEEDGDPLPESDPSGEVSACVCV